jgi:hypothetical protein
MKRFMNIRTLLVLACCLSLANMAVLVLSVLVPRALPVMAAMSLGQTAGFVSLAAFIVAISLDRQTPRGSSLRPAQASEVIEPNQQHLSSHRGGRT